MDAVAAHKPDTLLMDADATSSEVLRVVLVAPHAVLPARQSPGAAGYDLHACEPAFVPGGARAVVDTGVAVGLPPGTYGRIAPRSGLAVKNGIAVGAGVVDADYRGSLRVVLFNHGSEPFHVAPGDRIAQLILERLAAPDVQVVHSLSNTLRGDAGFGSTGV